MNPSAESPAQRQARIRREKREKKILHGGSARLEKITSLSGRPVEPAPPPPSDAPSQAPDPEEVDISTHSYPPRSGNSLQSSQGPALTEADVQRLLRSNNQLPLDNAQPDFLGILSADAQAPYTQGMADQDPMMQILQQMMGGASPRGTDIGGDGGDSGGLSPGFASMLGMDTGMDSQPPQATTYIWKILHAVFSLLLGLYILYTHPFSGARIDRLPFSSSTDSRTELFWVFATVELGLQGARYLLQGGRDEGGIMSTVIRFLPQPWKGRARLAERYSGIWTTMVGDAMVVIWVLGASVWWKGGTV